MAVDELVRRATGFSPYQWQVRLALEGLPEVLEVPTGCGKTAAVVLAWLFRRRFHADRNVRSETPRRLVFTLPLRTLVEQTVGNVVGWLGQLGLTDAVGNGDVLVRAMLGGERGDDSWRVQLEQDAVIVGTLDMVLSRALNRGYGSNRYLWPVDFGLLNNDCHFVFDEVQLMGAAVPTSRQLHAFRASFGVTEKTGSTWMSATLDRSRLSTVDCPEVPPAFVLEPADAAGDLSRRLAAERTFLPWLDDDSAPADRTTARAEAVMSCHRRGTLTLVVVNTVDAAQALHAAMARVTDEVPVMLLHSRFRPSDRARAMQAALAAPAPAGIIVVSTQVVEAGIDLSATTLFTEVAPWSSIVQRAGRCNRDGRVKGATVRWDSPAGELPYSREDIEATKDQLETMSGQTSTTAELASFQVPERGGDPTLVLRRADLVRLFDTTPDLTGNDLDVSPFIRDGDDLDTQVCWRDLSNGVHAEKAPSRDELCPVPVGELRDWVKRQAKSTRLPAYRLEHLDRHKHRWVPAEAREIRPGQVFLLDSSAGGYTSATGWSPRSTLPVSAIEQPPSSDPAPLDETVGDDPASHERRWVTLSEHLCDVERVAGEVLDGLPDAMLPKPQRLAVLAAARWHDLGKAHEVFQRTMLRTKGDDEPDPGAGPWAKSGGSKWARHERPYFRHELASALALLSGAATVVGSLAEKELAVYLVAAHHGRVRLSIRSFPEEQAPPLAQDEPQRRFALGIWEGDEVPLVSAGNEVSPGTELDLSVMELGSVDDRPSWTEMAVSLRDRKDLGPFRLAFLEAIVRMADWRASTSYRAPAGEGS